MLEDTADFDKNLDNAAKNGFNAIILDFKTAEGFLTYDSKLITYPEKDKYETINQSVIKRIKNRGFLVVARIFCFEDSIAPQRLNAYVYEDAEKTKINFNKEIKDCNYSEIESALLHLGKLHGILYNEMIVK